MHLLLTDRLACPRCGPDFGLILLADRLEDRRVLEGRLGCPNCRDRFPVTDGFGDLRAPPRTPLDAAPEAGLPAHEETVKLAALLGVTHGPGHVALLGRVARHAAPLADLLDGVEIVAVGPELRGRPEREGVSRLVARPGLPFFTGSLRGVALSAATSAAPAGLGPPPASPAPEPGPPDARVPGPGPPDAPAARARAGAADAPTPGPTPFLADAIRVAGPSSRVVVLDVPPDHGEALYATLSDAGLTVILDESGVLVGTREPGAGGRAGKGVALPVFPGPPGRNP